MWILVLVFIAGANGDKITTERAGEFPTKKACDDAAPVDVPWLLAPPGKPGVTHYCIGPNMRK